MSDQGTITAKFRVDPKGAKEGLDDIKRQARAASGEFSKLFALEPVGTRRGERALTRLVEGMTAASDASQGAMESVTAFGRAVSVGFAGGVVIGAVSTLANRFVQAHEEAEALNTSIHNIETSSRRTSAFRGAEEITSDIQTATKQVDDLDLHLKKMGRGQDFSGIGGAIRGFGQGQANNIEAWLHLQGADSYIKDLEDKRTSAAKATSREIDTQADKIRETASVEQTRFRVGEAEAALQKEDIRFREEQGKLSDESKQAGVDGLSVLHASREAHEQIVKELTVQKEALERQYATSQKIADVQRVEAIALNSSTSAMERQKMTAQASLDIAKEQLNAAEKHAAVAEATTAPGSDERKKAQLEVTEAQTGVQKAAAGVGDAAASSFAAGAAEYNMDNASKGAQYNQRLAQYQAYQRYAQARGMDPNIIPKPEMGAVEYDATAGIRNAVAQHAAAVAQEGPYADMTLAEQLKSGRFDSTDAPPQYPDISGGVSPEQARAYNYGTINGKPAKPSSSAQYPWSIPDSAYGDSGGEARIGGLMYPSSGYGRDTGAMTGMQPTTPLPAPTAQPSGLPSPPSDDGGLADKVAKAVKEVMEAVWGR